MAGAMEKVMRGMLHMSDSQKAFSPWWEDLEGKLLYSLMILGKVQSYFVLYCQGYKVCSPIVCHKILIGRKESGRF